MYNTAVYMKYYSWPLQKWFTTPLEVAPPQVENHCFKPRLRIFWYCPTSEALALNVKPGVEIIFLFRLSVRRGKTYYILSHSAFLPFLLCVAHIHVSNTSSCARSVFLVFLPFFLLHLHAWKLPRALHGQRGWDVLCADRKCPGPMLSNKGVFPLAMKRQSVWKRRILLRIALWIDRKFS